MSETKRPPKKPKRNRIEALVDRLHNPALAEKEYSMVYVLFNDGELCLTKCGSLLWQRGLHQGIPPLDMSFGTFPVPYRDWTCCFVTKEDAERILDAMGAEYTKRTGEVLPKAEDRYPVKVVFRK